MCCILWQKAEKRRLAASSVADCLIKLKVYHRRLFIIIQKLDMVSDNDETGNLHLYFVLSTIWWTYRAVDL